jgi:O-methyltransferase involved in polyketide biosynthesis
VRPAASLEGSGDSSIVDAECGRPLGRLGDAAHPVALPGGGQQVGRGAFKDKMAERFHDAIAYDWEKFDGHGLQSAGIETRTQILDREVGAFVDAHPEGLVVNLGGGLDTRFYRLDNGTIGWIDLDLPAVIAFRRKLREPVNPRRLMFAASVLDDEWLPQMRRFGRSRLLFVAEGLFPYFTGAQHRAVFARLSDNFPGQEMLFQTSAPSALREFAHLSVLSKLRTRADMEWGLEEGADVWSLDPRARFVDEYPLFEGYDGKMPEPARRRFTPELIKKAAKIVRVRFE